MDEQRKISIRKILQATVTILVTGACITAILSAARLQDVKKLQGFDITIKNDKFSFVDKEDIKNMLVASSNVSLDKISISKLDAHKMERIVNASPWIAGSQVYVGNDKMVHVNVVQRVPVARLFDQAGNSYYLDGTLKSMPLSEKYVHYTTVVTNVPVLNDDSISNDLKAQIVAVVRRVERDSFWAAQISQIMLTDDRTFELVPVLGNQKILLGDTTLLNQKFDNLFAFYKKVLNRIGWDKYEVLDVRYKGQVVASPALAWKVPFDKAVSNMNWVKSIIGNDQPDVVGDMASGTKVATTNTVTTPVVTAAAILPPKPVAAAPKPAVVTTPVATTPKPVATPVKQAVVTKPSVIPAAKATAVVKPVENKTKTIVATPPKTTVQRKPVETVKHVDNKTKQAAVKPAQKDKVVPSSKAVKKPVGKAAEVKKVQKKTDTHTKQTKEKEEPKPKYLYQTH